MANGNGQENGNGAKRNAVAQKLTDALLTSLLVTAVMGLLGFFFGVFDDARKATPTLYLELRVLTEQVKVLSEQQRELAALLNTMRDNDVRTRILEQRVVNAEANAAATAQRVTDQLRDLATQVGNIQQSITRQNR